MRPAALAIDLRPNADWAFANGRQKLVLGIALCLPVPVLATSGLAMPLPSTVYRAAVALVGQTQALAGAVAPLAPTVAFGESDPAAVELVADTPSATRRSSSSAKQPATARGTRADGVAGKRSPSEASRRPSVHTFTGTATPGGSRAAKPDRAEPSARLIEFTPAPARSANPASGVQENDETKPHNPARSHSPASEAPSTTRTEPQKHPEPKAEPPSGEESRKPSPPPEDESPTNPTSPITAVPPPPVLVVPPGEDLPTVLPPAKSAREVLQAIIADYAAIAVTGKAKQALDSLKRAEQSLGQSPPNRKDAMAHMEAAAGQVEGAVNDGLLTQAQGNDVLSRIANAGKLMAEAEIAEAKARSGDPAKIADAELKLARGDAELALGQYRSALGRYKDALNRADGA